jgi:hypothetical protein
MVEDRFADTAASSEVLEHWQMRESELLRLLPSQSQRPPYTQNLLMWLLRRHRQTALVFKVFQLLDAAHAVLGSDQRELSMALACWGVVTKLDRHSSGGNDSLRLAIEKFNASR